MKTRSTLTAGAVISAIFGVLIGNLIKNLPEHFGLSDLVGILFIIFGLLSVLSSIPTLVYSLSCLHTAGGKINLVLALINLAFGVALIFYHSEIVLIVAAAYLIIIPLMQIIFCKKDQRRAAVRSLAPKIVIGILIVAFFPAAAGLADKVFALILQCVGWAIIAISVVFLAVSLFVLYIRPLFSKKRPKNDGTIYLDDEDFKDKNN